MHSDMTSPIHDMGSRVGCQEAVCCICCIAGCRGPDLQEKSSLYRDWVAMQAGLVFHPPVGEPAARLAAEARGVNRTLMTTATFPSRSSRLGNQPALPGPSIRFPTLLSYYFRPGSPVHRLR